MIYINEGTSPQLSLYFSFIYLFFCLSILSITSGYRLHNKERQKYKTPHVPSVILVVPGLPVVVRGDLIRVRIELLNVEFLFFFSVLQSII